jgi:2-polyprenyl-6-methoxyphenol hydroxylase-like FAD-dependent oxidoreductase
VPFRNVGEGLTPYPFVLDFAQDAHERLLIAQLQALGGAVERRTELLGIVDEGQLVCARLRTPSGAEDECRCQYVAGCDGAHSAVRDVLGVSFGGGTYEHLFYVADVTGTGPAVDRGIHVDLDESDLLAIFDMKAKDHVRLVGTVPVESDAGRRLTFEDVSKRPITQLHLEVERVNWFSTYRVHHKVANRFRVGRAFLLGDAAHVHSPVGAQGMNTGIGDAVNLAWKLAAVIDRTASARLLDSYEAERIAFARRLVATTDRAFEIATRTSRTAAFVRTKIFPLAVAILFRSRAVRRFLFRTVSQIEIRYRRSPLSTGKAGAVRGGDRLPWVAPEIPDGDDNYEMLKSLRWQVHVYGTPTGTTRKACEQLALPLHVFTWRSAVKRAGLARNALYLVRPDGYVALADAECRGSRLREYFGSSIFSARPE